MESEIVAAIEYRYWGEWHSEVFQDSSGVDSIRLGIGPDAVLFAILAGIRGAGVKPVVPVDCGLRGLPGDLSEEARELMAREARWGWHWLALRELLDYDWGECGPLQEMDLVVRDREMARYREAIRLGAMQQLSGTFGEENVRLVMGFS